MPRIDAASIEEHVRLQTARILDAATALFRERGYGKTDMDDIAHAVGLARNSLYRYYKNKDFILLACVERDMGAFVERMRTLDSLYPDPVQRIGAWLDMQMDMATSPAHATMELMAEIRTDAPELRKRLMELHDAPGNVLQGTVAEIARGKRRDTGLIIALIKGMVEAAAGQAMRRENKMAVKRELRRAVERVLEG
jgi:AcrR family transcriptional regulator